MEKENAIKVVITGAIGTFCAYMEILVVPLILMTVLMAVDYATGLTKAYINSELNSKQGFTGILKKFGYFLIVLSAMSVDYLIQSTLLGSGITLPENFTFAILVIIWLMINELISILENLSTIGVPMPSILLTMVTKLKVMAESKTDEIHIIDIEEES